MPRMRTPSLVAVVSLLLVTVLTACGQPAAATPAPATQPAAKATSPAAAASPAAAGAPTAAAKAASPAAGAPTAAAKTGAAPSGEPVKFGANFALTIAGGSPIAPLYKEGMDLFVDETNQAGGVLGRPLQVVYYDDENSQEKAAQFARKLIDDDKVIGQTADRTANALVIMPIAEQAGSIYINGNPAYYAVAGKKWGFQVNATDEVEARLLMKYIKETAKLSSIVILHDDNQYGTEGSKSVEAVATKEFGLEVKGSIPYNNASPDLSTETARARATGAQAIVTWGIPPGPARIATAARNTGWDAPMFSSTAGSSLQLVQLAGQAVEGMVFPGYYDPANPTGPDKHFVDAYRARYNRDPAGFAVFGWDTLLLITEAIKKAGSTDRNAVRDALENLKGVQAVQGTYNLSPQDHNGMDPGSMMLIRIKNGKFELAQGPAKQ